MTVMEAANVAADAGVMNGLEDGLVHWDAVRWRAVDRDVRRLRQRIFAASQAGDLKKVRNLQKLMLRSRANALVSVRRVTEINTGRKTAGVDGKVVVTAQDKVELADWVQHQARPWSPRPVKRVYVVRRVALGCISCPAGRNLEECFWI
jgi:RNA-directed DNA polymerase